MKLAHLVGEVLDEKYRIEKLLGQGGMGAVFLATHLGTERPVALKVITPEYMRHGEFVERFRREARAAGRLRHPNVVDVTDFGFARVGADARVAYLVMEYLDGCTLAEVLTEESTLPVGWVVDILEQTCSAVDEAHQQGIVHRDLKPDNIWLEPNRRGSYTVKVLDFGIARLGDSAQADESEEPRGAGALANAQTSSLSLLESPTLIPSSGDALPPSQAETIKSKPMDEGSGARLKAELAESPTIIRSPSTVADNDEEESSTRLITSKPTAAEDGTLMLNQPTTNKQQGAITTTEANERLTRIGSILGTPLYMSPEQCRGENSDARSDIYSLGVIGYQMLSGQTPFNGNMETVIRQHLTEPPPPLEIKKVPKKVAGVIMSALAKDPANRPSTAAAFGNALRAHSEGTSSLLRRALTLFSEHLPLFLRLVVIVYSPLLLIIVLQLLQQNLTVRGTIPKLAGAIMSMVLSLLTMLISFFVASVIVGMTTRLVTQLLVAPLRPLKLKPAFAALRKRLKPLFITSMALSFLTVLGMLLCVVPAFYVLITYYLVTPVVMMEDVRGRAAFRRAKELAKRSRRTVVTVILIQICIPFLMGALIGFLAVSVIKAYNPGGLHVNTFNNLFQLAQIPLTLVLAAFSSIVTALLYWKTRLAGGETLREVFREFEDEEMPDRNWQKRMRERLHPTARTQRNESGRSRLDR
jgi:serine/threonine protein kinase